VHLSNLVSVEDGNPNDLHGLINFAKRKLVHDVITDVLQYQQEPYKFPAVPEIQQILKDSFLISEKTDEEMFKLSLEVEPRGWDGSSPILKQSKPSELPPAMSAIKL
jgi:hypothetical protein